MNMDNAFEQKIALQKKFYRVSREISKLKSKIYKKEGFWFFKTHVYSQESLFNSEHHAKIYAITEKIGNDAISWNRFGQLTQETREVYESQNHEVMNELKQVDL
jgi:hypothetical protein